MCNSDVYRKSFRLFTQWCGHIPCTRSVGQSHRFTDILYTFHKSVTLCSAGVLGKCHHLQIIPSGNYHQRLTWDPPSTLNITTVEPDISSYIVCSNISTECTTINVTVAEGDSSDLQQYTFLNLRTYINFTVTAVNIVGDGESASIVYEPCEHTEESSKWQTVQAVVSFDSESVPSLSVEVTVSALYHKPTCC